jgi:hypothetical protein
MKSKKFNLNDKVCVRLTDHGRTIVREKNESTIAMFHSLPNNVIEDLRKPVKEDIQGWSEWQLWELMQVFGPYMFMGKKQVFKNNDILIKGSW